MTGYLTCHCAPLCKHKRCGCHTHDSRGLPPRFWQKVYSAPSGCWIWLGSLNSCGYGEFWMDGKVRKAHRISYAAHLGPFPDGLVLDHLCRVPRCVNPIHLEPVEQRINIIRGTAPTTAQNRDTCRNGLHPWPESAEPYRTGFRCIECKRLGARRRYLRKIGVAV